MVKCQFLTALAEVKRTEKNKVYSKGTLYIQVSACKRGGESAWMILKKESILEDKYAVVIPTVEIIPEYLKIALEYQTPAWHAKYVGTNINISMDSFKFLKVQYETDLDTQKRYVEMIETAEKCAENEKKMIEELKTMKEWYLKKLFI